MAAIIVAATLESVRGALVSAKEIEKSGRDKWTDDRKISDFDSGGMECRGGENR